MKNKATLKNSSPKQGMGLHHYIATGGDPKDYEGMVESPEQEKNEQEK